MLTVFTDQVTRSSSELQDCLEDRVAAIAPNLSFDYIYKDHREFAQNTARSFNSRRLERIQGELMDGQQILKAKEILTRPKEFYLWKQSLQATSAEIRKCEKLALTFEGFSVEKIVAIASVTNIYLLCATKFVGLVEKLRELPVLAADGLKQMIKEARPPRKPKQPQQPESSVEWQRDDSGGGRHLAVNLYNDELATKIIHSAEEQQVTAMQVIAQAFLKSELVEQAQSECKMHIEMQREIIQQQHERIEELQAQIQVIVPSFQPNLKPGKERKPVIYIENFRIWEELAEAVNCESDRLLAVAKLASASERSQFAQMLSEFFEKEPKALDCVDWVPQKLLNCALTYLNFSVQRFATTARADDPAMETVQGCKFVSVINFGTSGERWVFQLPTGKNVPVSSREQFDIERF